MDTRWTFRISQLDEKIATSMITNAANWKPSTSLSTGCSRHSWEILLSPPRLGNKCSWSSPSCPKTAPSRASETAASSPAAPVVCTSSSRCLVSFSANWLPEVLSTALRGRFGREVRRNGFVLLDWNELCVFELICLCVYLSWIFFCFESEMDMGWHGIFGT